MVVRQKTKAEARQEYVKALDLYRQQVETEEGFEKNMETIIWKILANARKQYNSVLTRDGAG